MDSELIDSPPILHWYSVYLDETQTKTEPNDYNASSITRSHRNGAACDTSIHTATKDQ
jgi:hypothetical protein